MITNCKECGGSGRVGEHSWQIADACALCGGTGSIEVEESEGFANDCPGALVTSVRVTRVGSHDQVAVWNRGGLAGTLKVKVGDGVKLAKTLLPHDLYVNEVYTGEHAGTKEAGVCVQRLTPDERSRQRVKVLVESAGPDPETGEDSCVLRVEDWMYDETGQTVLDRGLHRVRVWPRGKKVAALPVKDGDDEW